MKIIICRPNKKQGDKSRSAKQGNRSRVGILYTAAATLLAFGIVYVCTSPSLVVAETAVRNVDIEPQSLAVSLTPAVVYDPKKTDNAAVMTVEAFKSQMFMPLDGIVTSTEGMRSDPFGSGSVEYHRGTDIMPTGDLAVRAADDGIVTYAGYDEGYGNHIIIDHGGISTLYAHCEYLYVDKGDSVTRGMLIAKCGESGRATGVHLHFEVNASQ